MNVLIVHCWGCDCESNWFPWLKNELVGRGALKVATRQPFTVVCPNLPNSEFPKKEEWLAEIRNRVKKFDESWVLVGHSLGCPTILRLLEVFDSKEIVKAVILVSGFARDVGYEELKNFVDKDFKWEKIRKTSEKFVVIHSEDDPLIPFKEGQYLAKQLQAEFIVEQGLGHIKGEPYGRYQRILDIILTI